VLGNSGPAGVGSMASVHIGLSGVVVLWSSTGCTFAVQCPNASDALNTGRSVETPPSAAALVSQTGKVVVLPSSTQPDNELMIGDHCGLRPISQSMMVEH
jgi:hypothetical protein